MKTIASLLFGRKSAEKKSVFITVNNTWGMEEKPSSDGLILLPVTAKKEEAHI